MLVDKARITIVSGKGGNGAVSFRREPWTLDTRKNTKPRMVKTA